MATWISGSPMSGYAGEPCQMPGEYRSSCIHNHRTRIEEGQLFPDCSGRDMHGCGSDTLRGIYWHRVND